MPEILFYLMQKKAKSDTFPRIMGEGLVLIASLVYKTQFVLTIHLPRKRVLPSGGKIYLGLRSCEGKFEALISQHKISKYKARRS